MGDLSVDVTSLRALSGHLRSGADELGAALRELDGATPGQLGADPLDSACQEFQEQWRYGMSLIRDNVAKVGAGLDATADTYQRHEQDLARLFAGILRPAEPAAQPDPAAQPAEPDPAAQPAEPDPAAQPAEPEPFPGFGRVSGTAMAGPCGPTPPDAHGTTSAGAR